MNEERRDRSLSVLLSVVVVSVLLVASGLLYLLLTRPQLEGGTSGTLLINDAGESHGGFEYAADYIALLQGWTDGRKEISFELEVGLGDALGVHALRVSEFDWDDETMTLRTDAGTIRLIMTLDDEQWGERFDGLFLAVHASSNEDENIGSIEPEMLGLPSHYYVLLALPLPAVS